MSTPKHFDISQLPSVKAGMSIEEEQSKRRKTCRFIEEAGIGSLSIGRVATSTAMVFFHRFYAKHTFSEHDRFEVAVACLLLAAKVEESPKKLNVLVSECHKLKVRGQQAGRISTVEGSVPLDAPRLDEKSEEFSKLKQRILLLERVILHTIGFELSVDHPYKFLVEQIRMLTQMKQVEYIEPSSAVAGSTSQTIAKMRTQMVQIAMNFANDSMQTILCLQFPPQQIATACVYLAANIAKVRPVGMKDWLDILGQPDVEDLAVVALEIVELIAQRRGSDQSSMAKVRSDLEKLKKMTRSEKPKPPPPSHGPPDAKRARVS